MRPNSLLRLAATICVAFAAPCRGWAQLESGEVRLRVADPSGLPLPFASGVLRSDAVHAERRFTTDGSGRYTFEHLPFGAYGLTVEHRGFERQMILLDVRSAIPREVTARMPIGAVSTQVDVTGNDTLLDRHRTGVVNAIGSKQIQEQQSSVPARGISDLVSMQPGWVLENSGMLHPRGLEYQTLLVVDGLAMDENRSPAFAPQLDLGGIQSMSVLTGGFPAEYGRKLGGIIEVTTDQDLKLGFHGSAEGSGGSFGTAGGSFSSSYGWKQSAFVISADRGRTDRYLDPPVLGNFANTGSFGGITAVYHQDITPGDRVQLSISRRQTRFQAPNELIQQAAGQRQDRNAMEAGGQAVWTHLFPRELLLNVRASVEDLSANLWSNSLSTPIIAAQQRGFRRGSVTASIAASKGGHDLKLGGDAYYAPVSEALQYRITDLEYFDKDVPPSFDFRDRRLDREQSLFAQDTFRAGNFTLSAGLRYDHYSLAVEDSAWSPRLGLAWYWPKGDLVLRGSYDRVFITPAMENLLLSSSPAAHEASPEAVRIPVQPSRGNFYEAGFGKRLMGKIRLDVSFYRRTLRNFADDDLFLNTGVSFPIAFRSARIQGVETKLDLPRWRGLSGFVSYSQMVGSADLPAVGGLFLSGAAETQATGSFPISQDQRNTVRARARYQIRPRLWAAVIAQYGSGLPVEIEAADIESLTEQYGGRLIRRVNFSAGRVRPNFSVDGSAGADLWKSDSRVATLQVTGQNLTNRLNLIGFSGLFSGTTISPPRSFSARLRLEF
jgi:hypothetical protein